MGKWTVHNFPDMQKINKKQIVFILAIALLLSGCNHLRTFPLYSEVYVEHPESIKLSYYEVSEYNTPEMLAASKRIEDYLSKNPDTTFSIEGALRALKVEKGMTKEQVVLVIGEPWEKKDLNDMTELWKYKKYDEKDYRFLLTLNDLTELKFRNGILIDYDRWAYFDKISVYLIRKRIEAYFGRNLDLSKNIKDIMSELGIQKGMNKKQVFLVVGEPTAKKILKDNGELWIYKGDRSSKGERDWYYGWGKLRFKEEILVDIEVQYINIYK